MQVNFPQFNQSFKSKKADGKRRQKTAKETQKIQKKQEAEQTSKSCISKQAVLLGLTVIAGTGALIHCVRKHNVSNIKNTAELNSVQNTKDIAEQTFVKQNIKSAGGTLETGVKKFKDEAQNIADGVRLKGGTAVKKDGSLFTGAMDIVNKKGDKYTINYKNGAMVSSLKNDKLYKTYETTVYKGLQTSFNNETKGGSVLKSIKTYNNDKLLKECRINKTPDGVLERIFKADYKKGTADAVNYRQDGSILTQSKYFGPKYLMLTKQNIFDENGKLSKVIESTERRGYKLTDVKTGKVGYYDIKNRFFSDMTPSPDLEMHHIIDAGEKPWYRKIKDKIQSLFSEDARYRIIRENYYAGKK